MARIRIGIMRRKTKQLIWTLGISFTVFGFYYYFNDMTPKEPVTAEGINALRQRLYPELAGVRDEYHKLKRETEALKIKNELKKIEKEESF